MQLSFLRVFVCRLKAARSQQMKNGGVVLFFLTLESCLKRGMTIEASLKLLCKSPQRCIRNCSICMMQRMQTGENFSTSLMPFLSSSIKKLLGGFLLAGERLGKMPMILNASADILKKRQVLRSKMFRSLLYPLMLLVVFVMCVFILSDTLQPILQVLQQEKDVHHGVVQNGWLFQGWLFLLTMIVVLGYVLYCFKKYGTLLFFKIPIIGNFLISGHLMLFFTILEKALESALPPVDALRLAREALRYQSLKACANHSIEALKSGKTIDIALTSLPCLTEDVLHLLGVAHITGNVPQLCRHITHIYVQRVEFWQEMLACYTGPIALFFIGGGFVWLVHTMIMPFYEAVGMIGA